MPAEEYTCDCGKSSTICKCDTCCKHRRDYVINVTPESRIDQESIKGVANVLGINISGKNNKDALKEIFDRLHIEKRTLTKIKKF